MLTIRSSHPRPTAPPDAHRPRRSAAPQGALTPVRRRLRVVRTLAPALLLVALFAGCLSPDQETGLHAVNVDRAAHGLRTLSPQAQLQAKAQAWAELLAREGGIRHSTITAGLPSCWRKVGENVGYGGSIQLIETAYMNSPHHRENILDPTFTYGAVGVAKGGNRIYTVQEFMSGC